MEPSKKCSADTPNPINASNQSNKKQRIETGHGLRKALGIQSLPGDWNLRPPPERSFSVANPNTKVGRIYQDAWLGSSYNWPLKYPGWTPIKVLGIGGYGICGLFQYTHTDTQTGGAVENKYVVVKQVGYSQGSGKSKTASLDEEYMFLTTMKDVARSDHVVKAREKVTRGRGSGANRFWDPDHLDFPVARLYLEYCDKGDLHDRIAKNKSKPPLPEEDVWRLWECLAKGLMVLENGSEDEEWGWDIPSEKTYWRRRAIAHFDIKPQNIFIGGDARTPGKHTNVDIYKFADFGLSMKVPIDKAAQKAQPWLKEASWRGTRGWKTPEQLFKNLYGYRIGTPSNTFAVAKCIYSVITRGNVFNTSRRFKAHRRDGTTFWASGADLITRQLPYSETLLGLIIRCLAHDPDERPTAKQLLTEIQHAVRAFDGWATDMPYDYDLQTKRRDPPRTFVIWDRSPILDFGIDPVVETVREKKIFPPGVSNLPLSVAKNLWENIWDLAFGTPKKDAAAAPVVAQNKNNKNNKNKNTPARVKADLELDMGMGMNVPGAFPDTGSPAKPAKGN